MNNTIWKNNHAVCAQYAQALRAVREEVGENPARDLERTIRIDPKTLGNLIAVVQRHHEVLVQLDDPVFFTRSHNPKPTAHRYQASTPVGTFLFDMDYSQAEVAARNICY